MTCLVTGARIVRIMTKYASHIYRRPSPAIFAALTLILFLCAAAGCGSSSTEVVRTVVDGVEVVSNPDSPLPLDGLPRRLRFVRLQEYPQYEEDPHYQFALGNVVVDRDGSIFIADSPQHRILKFDSEWQYVQTIGRRGEGPGEFLEIAWMGLTPDGILYASDEQNRRTTLYDAGSCSYIDYIPYPNPGFRRASLLGSERLFAIYSQWVPEEEKSVFRWGIFDLSFQPVRLLIDREDPALGDVSGISRAEWLGRMDGFVPEPSLIFQVTSHGELIAGHDFEHRFSLYDALGNEVRRIEREGPPSLLTEADRREIIDMNIRRWERYNDPDVARAAVQHLEWPEQKQAYNGVLDLDRRGFLLVGALDEEGTIWMYIYGRDGTYLARQLLPEFNRLYQVVGDTLYAAYEDETGNTHLMAYLISYLVGEGADAREVTASEWFGWYLPDEDVPEVEQCGM